MKKFALILSLLTLVAFSSAQVYSTGQEVIDAIDAKDRPDSLSSEMSMVITSASGQSLSRTMQSWGKDDNRIVKFTDPADIRGSGLLSLDDGEGNESSYLWLPALGRVRRLSTSGEDQDGAFFGSDFTYEDLGFEVSEWDAELLETNEEDGDFIYVLKATVKDGFTSQYDYVIFHVRESDMMPIYSELYKDGELSKKQSLGGVVEVDGYTLPTSLRMENVQTGSFTVIEQENYEVDADVPDEVFTERFLKR